MSKAKHLRRQRAEERSRQESKHAAVIAERNRCAKICDDYADRAAQHGLIVHPQLARELAAAIREETA